MRVPASAFSLRAAAPGRPKQGPTQGHAGAPSWPTEGRAPYPVIGVQS
jgi:hypothetical protein